MRGMRIIGLLALAALAGCGEPTITDAQQAAADAAADVVPPPPVLSRTSVEIYPEAAEVRLTTFDSEKAEGERDVDHGRLTRAQRRAIERTISIVNYGPGSRAAAACFVPHHFLQYYDAGGRKVGEIAICFCCAGIRSDPVIDAPLPQGAASSELSFDYDALKGVLEGMGVPTNIACSDDEA